MTYVDKVFGEVTTPNAAQQDFVLLRSDGVPLYNFGAVVDDMTMEISLVARGRDHMVNTPPQIMIYEAFGAKAPEFAHLPMMLAPSGEKLSKRHGAVSVARVPRSGLLAERGAQLPRALRLVARRSRGVLEGRAGRGVRLGGVRARRREVRHEEIPRDQPRAPEGGDASRPTTSTRRASCRSSRSAGSPASTHASREGGDPARSASARRRSSTRRIGSISCSAPIR